MISTDYNEGSYGESPEILHKNDRERRSHSRERYDYNKYAEISALKDHWRAVKDNLYDFDAWTSLLKLVEKMNDEKHVREAFDGFLHHYPFCYGYWKKYADLERQHKHYEKCLAVYEKGLEAIPLSVDLWLSYIGYVKEIARGQRQATSKIRDVYMRALEACGLEFRSDRLWDDYIEWEIQNYEYSRASALFEVLIVTPTINYQKNFEKYKSFVNSYEPDKIISQEEYDELSDIVSNRLKGFSDGPLYYTEEVENHLPANDEEATDIPSKTVVRKHNDLALRAFREEILNRRYKMYLENEREVNLRWAFETTIKRPYFHVKPLEREQLRNWHNYLDFEIKHKKKTRITFLFERCVISCALYEEIWIRYAAYLESIDETVAARSVYQRAIGIHVTRKPGIYLAFSVFEEKNGDVETAIKILSDFDRRNPDYSSITLRLISIERRVVSKNENPDYSGIIARYERLIQDNSNSRKLASFYSMKLARFHAKCRHDRKLAKKIIKDAISRDKDNVQLYLQLVDLSYNSSHMRDSEVITAFDTAIESRELTPEDRFQFSLRKLEFLEELGCDSAKLHQHIAHHLALEKSIAVPPTLTIFHGKRIPLNKEVSIEAPSEKKIKI